MYNNCCIPLYHINLPKSHLLACLVLDILGCVLLNVCLLQDNFTHVLQLSSCRPSRRKKTNKKKHLHFDALTHLK